MCIGIIPTAAGLGAHTQTAFWIFDDNLVKVEILTAALDITRPDEIEIYANRIQSDAAGCKLRPQR